MGNDILCVNAGSSSLKFAVFRVNDVSETKLISGEIEDIGEQEGRFRLRAQDGHPLVEKASAFSDHPQAVEAMLSGLEDQGVKDLAGVGHRLVHGGPDLFDPQTIDNRLLSRLKEVIPFAPLHLPSQLGTIERMAQRWPGLLQVACFDTAFHRDMPEIARRFSLPRELWEKGILRYGFHGLSYEFIVSALGPKLGPRAIIAHLGNGASMVALRAGRSIDTTMGLTPAGGFMMGTRSGDLDPGILLYLLRQGWSAEGVAKMIERESGLAGVSGGISDMKVLLDRKDDSRSVQAIAMFCYQVRKFIGAYAAALNGLDTLVFTGGIGERAAEIRAGICRGLGFLGIEVDERRNSTDAEIISADGCPCVVRVIRTDEDVVIARHTQRVVAYRELSRKT